LGTALGIVFAFRVPGWLGVNPRWGAAGLPLGSGLAGWLEVALLRWSLVGRVGRVEIGVRFALRLWLVALVAAAAARAAALAAPGLPPLLGGAVTLSLYGVLYLAGSALIGVRESREFLLGLRATVQRRRGRP
jgi:putative peptidoglycan lipid II flippase